MNGILPPQPIAIAGAPKNARDADCSAASSAGSVSGACQPGAGSLSSRFTSAPSGAFSVNSLCSAGVAVTTSVVGGSRNARFAVV